VGILSSLHVAAAPNAVEGVTPTRPAPSPLLSHWPELLLFAIGAVLRLSAASTYDVRLGYDFQSHATVIAWYALHATLAPFDITQEAYHPPLYHALAGWLARSGASVQDIATLSLALGIGRLALLFAGVHMILPRPRMAKLLALGSAVILPASVHMDLMVTNEPLSSFLATGAMLLMVPVSTSRTWRRWLYASLLGLLLGLALLTKVSATVVGVAVALAALAQLVREGDGGLRGRFRRLAPLLASLAIVGLSTGWFFMHCKRQYGKAVLTAFDGPGKFMLAPAEGVPYLKRRPLRYFVGWDAQVYAFPYFPSAALPEARFFPQVLASTFVDYFNYGLAGLPARDEPAIRANFRSLRPAALWPSRASMAGGTVIALVTAGAWFAVLVASWRRRAYGILGLLLVPLLAVAGQAHFTVMFPSDVLGPVKGVYLQFAAGPLFGLFGLGVAWLWQRRAGRPVAWLAMASLAAVACYLGYCLVAAG
jgi:hypothetical protein